MVVRGKETWAEYRKESQMIIERMGEATPGLDEMLEVLGAKVEGDKLVIPTHAIKETPDGIEVNVQHHYSRLHQGKWKLPIIDREIALKAGRQVAEDGSII